jgi:hypothetical protein
MRTSSSTSGCQPIPCPWSSLNGPGQLDELRADVACSLAVSDRLFDFPQRLVHLAQLDRQRRERIGGQNCPVASRLKRLELDPDVSPTARPLGEETFLATLE